MLPCEIILLGSTAKTATFFPKEVKCLPKASINVLFLTPGTPVIPIRTDLFACGKQAVITSLAFAKWLALMLSTKVIARLRAEIFSDKITSINSCEEGCFFYIFGLG